MGLVGVGRGMSLNNFPQHTFFPMTCIDFGVNAGIRGFLELRNVPYANNLLSNMNDLWIIFDACQYFVKYFLLINWFLLCSHHTLINTNKFIKINTKFLLKILMIIFLCNIRIQFI